MALRLGCWRLGRQASLTTPGPNVAAYCPLRSDSQEQRVEHILEPVRFQPQEKMLEERRGVNVGVGQKRTTWAESLPQQNLETSSRHVGKAIDGERSRSLGEESRQHVLRVEAGVERKLFLLFRLAHTIDPVLVPAYLPVLKHRPAELYLSCTLYIMRANILDEHTFV